MKKWALRVFTLLLAAILLAGIVLPALATEIDDSEVTGNQDSRFKRIRNVEDLKAIAEDPDGSYLLVEDLDMTGVEWKPLDFTGTFDGGGHAILNLNITQLGDTKAEAYDGNRKGYECSYAGLFGTIQNAEIMNLKLLNVRSVLQTDEPCFLGGLAGYCYESTITDCSIEGTLELRAHNQIFGLGGMVGFGSGWIKSCSVDVTLICTDTDAETRDEQFMGGVYSTGFIDVTDTKVVINGYASDHGYAHNGGIVGLYLQHPMGTGRTGWIVRNAVSGKITFFEDNYDRRAYCAPFAGEVLVGSHNMYENVQHFQRDERWTYDQELRPCMCEEPQIKEYVVYPSCDKYGHTVRECYGCGYVDKDEYTFFQHTVTNWEVLEASTLKTEGTSEGKCDKCGETVQRRDPVVVPEETEPEAVPTESPEAAASVEATSAADTQQIQGKISILFLVLIVATVLLVVAAVFVVREMRKEK